MKTRRNRKRPDSQHKEKPFFTKKGGQADTNVNNHAGFFQPKLTIGEVNDPFEKEADEVADQVVHSTLSEKGKTSVRKKEWVQRQGEKEEEGQTKLQRQGEKEEEGQTKLQRQGEKEEEGQTKLQRQGDKEEEMQGRLQRQEGIEEEVQEKLQRQGENEEEDKAAAKLQRHAQNSVQRAGGKKKEPKKKQVSASFEKTLKQKKAKGMPLPHDVREKMEKKFDTSLKAVRIHTDVGAANLAQQTNAQAFTHGNDIFFNKGKFNPNSKEGLHLIAHELTHVVQQRSSK